MTPNDLVTFTVNLSGILFFILRQHRAYILAEGYVSNVPTYWLRVMSASYKWPEGSVAEDNVSIVHTNGLRVPSLITVPTQLQID